MNPMIDFDSFMPNDPAGGAAGDLEVLRLGDTPVLAALFTSKIDTATTHYIDTPSLRAEIHCNRSATGPCLACDLRTKATRRGILPVYAVEDDCVKVLLISDNRNPGALGPALKAEFNRGSLADRYLLLSRAVHKFTVKSVPIPAAGRAGEAAVTEFVGRLQSGQVDVARAVATYPNAELWDVPELERKAKALGLVRPAYAGTPPAPVDVDGGATA